MWNNRTVRLALWAIGVIILAYVLWNVRTIIIYFFIAAIIAFVARPLMGLLGKIKIKNWTMPSWLKSALVLIAFVFIVIGAFNFIIPTVIHQADIISKIDTDNLIQSIQPQIKSVTEWMERANIDQNEVQKTLEDEVTKLFSVGDIGSYIKGFISNLADSIIAVFSILFISFFLLKDGSIVDNVVGSLSPDKYLDKIKTIINDAKDLLSRYFIGVIIQISIVMIVITIGLTILGVQNALLIGLIAGIFNIIPYVGPLIGGLVGVSLAITSQLELHPDLNIMSFGLVAILPFAAAQLLDNFVLQPLIFSQSVKAHPLEIFIVILAAGSLGGVLGMILAVPVYSFLRIVAREFFNGYKVVQGLTKNL
ncbi:MAG: AI-2E family transporter [Bacteroidia bacterium]|nr:AI-2E family transporter [Bacteroidia bacterium]NNJ55623.1 AI-2E family transporter [Bacteroidia bacterium]